MNIIIFSYILYSNLFSKCKRPIYLLLFFNVYLRMMNYKSAKNMNQCCIIITCQTMAWMITKKAYNYMSHNFWCHAAISVTINYELSRFFSFFPFVTTFTWAIVSSVMIQNVEVKKQLTNLMLIFSGYILGNFKSISSKYSNNIVVFELTHLWKYAHKNLLNKYSYE